MESNNAAIIRKAYDDFAKGNTAAVLDAFDPAIAWHIPGHSMLSGDYKGPDRVLESKPQLQGRPLRSTMYRAPQYTAAPSSQQ